MKERLGIFFDKDGTLLEDMAYNVEPELIRLAPTAGDALQLFSKLDMDLFVITNQPGVALGYFPASALIEVEATLRGLFAQQGAKLKGFYYCPHAPEKEGTSTNSCLCRKPAPGLLKLAAHEHGINLQGSWMVGDILNDVEAGRRAGCDTILINNGNETEWHLNPFRLPDYFASDLLSAAQFIARVCLNRTYHENKFSN